MNDHARRGRNTIIAIIAVYFLLELLLIFFEVAVTHRPPDTSTFVRLGFSALLAWFLYRGMSWARWLWGILLLFGVLLTLALGVSFLDAADAHPVILLFSCAGLLYFLGSAVLLFLSPDVREYIGYRRSGSLVSGPLS